MSCKVLIISHNVLNMSTSMGRTLSGLIKNVLPENLAQLYLRAEVPTTDICTNYFRITDFDNIKKKKNDMGDIFTVHDIKEYTENADTIGEREQQIYRMGKKRKPYMYIGRNLIWLTNKWKNERLLNWLKEFNPDVIFYASSDYVFSYKIAMEISEICNIPIVTYVCDDYYFVKRKSLSPLYHINRIWFKKTMRRLFSKHKRVVAICDKITADYTKEFGVQSQTVMTSSSLCQFENKTEDSDIKVSYIGNMGYDRHIPLIQIGKTLKKLCDNILIDVYSAENRPEIINTLNVENGINFHASVPYNKVIDIMKESDILIHVESMDRTNVEKVKYSVSTKIADTLSCGRCLFAYGPRDVASIEYLKDNDCALVVTDENNLEESIKSLITDGELREHYVENALRIAEKKHNIEKNATMIQSIFKKVTKKE